MSLVSEFLQKVGLIRNETQYHGNTKERVADTFETLFNLDVWFKKVDSSDPKAGKLITWDGQAVEGGGLATDMNNLDDDILEADKKVIREKLGAAYEGLDNDNSGSYSGSVGGIINHNSGEASASLGGDTNTNSGEYSSSVGGADNTNSGKYSGSVGGQVLENKTLAETSRGQFNVSEKNHADSDTAWHDDDLIESVGGGTGFNIEDKLNLFARYKNGAFYWVKKTLSTITNAVKGFHAADEDGRLNYFDGTAWKKYLLEGEGGGTGIQDLPIVADQNFFETANSGIYYSADNTVLSDSNFKGFVKVSEWLYDFRTIEVTGWFDNYDYFMSQYYRLNDDGNSTYSLSYLGDALALNNFVPTSIQEQNNQNNLKFWTGTQAEYDAITTKNPQTLYIIN